MPPSLQGADQVMCNTCCTVPEHPGTMGMAERGYFDYLIRPEAMLVRTGSGSISFVAGCCWVNAVSRPPTRYNTPPSESPNQRDTAAPAPPAHEPLA